MEFKPQTNALLVQRLPTPQVKESNSIPGTYTLSVWKIKFISNIIVSVIYHMCGLALSLLSTSTYIKSHSSGFDKFFHSIREIYFRLFYSSFTLLFYIYNNYLQQQQRRKNKNNIFKHHGTSQYWSDDNNKPIELNQESVRL